jgi:hypothetical protein
LSVTPQLATLRPEQICVLSNIPHMSTMNPVQTG